eukprot:CAMPEP_0196576364 /NCGR_PEP_ID=MMETSP1081-20130531/5642_1 /TAXON_ID=36882 /ORGANISM="Pyramimonas amylifera, Strain CCMP720" /LENGTH=161 /DNA_ID=CAMNT_0041894947 /DNA_START=78 /DNA_END=560 /DNA_ORIENTATION=-
MSDPLLRIMSHMETEGVTNETVQRILCQGPEMETNKWSTQVALFDNFYIRFLLGKDVFMLPPGAINSTHEEIAKKVLQGFNLVVPQTNLQGVRQVLERVLGWDTGNEQLLKRIYSQTAPKLSPKKIDGELSIMKSNNEYDHSNIDALLSSHNKFDVSLYQW